MKVVFYQKSGGGHFQFTEVKPAYEEILNVGYYTNVCMSIQPHRTGINKIDMKTSSDATCKTHDVEWRGEEKISHLDHSGGLASLIP